MQLLRNILFYSKGDEMKNLIRTSLGAMAFLLLVSSAVARSKQDFDKFLKTVTDNAIKYSSEAHYEKLEFTNKQTGEKKKFSDFAEVDRFVFILMQCDVLSHEMEDLYNKWKEELKNAEDAPDDENEANKKDIAQYMEKLLAVRKENSEKVEALVSELFKKWPDKFTKEEQEYITKSIKDYHDKNNLIKRK